VPSTDTNSVEQAVLSADQMARAQRYPLVSILIPTYNYVAYVEQAVASAVAQTYPNVEVVVNDNCSTDGAWELLSERFGAEPRVRLSRNATNLGMNANFERVLELARGEYVMWLSSDDFLFPTHVEQLAARFASDPSLDVVYGNTYFARDDGVVHAVRAMTGQFPVDYVDARDELVENFTTVCPVCFPCMLLRRSVLAEPGIWRDPDATEIAGDWEIVMRLALAGKRFAYIARPSMAIRMHAGQSSGAEYHASGQNLLEFASFVERYLDHPEFVRRMHGREIGVAALLAVLHRDSMGRNGGISPLDEEQQARLRTLQERLLTRAVTYEPARVRESRISVVIEAAAPPPLVLRSIESLSAQRWEGWELVVVDHGPIPLESLLRALPVWERTSYVRMEGGPLLPGAARNFGLRMIRGEYVAFLEPGNRFSPEHLATAVETIARAGTQASAAAVRLVLEFANTQGIVSERLGEIAPFGGADEADVALLAVAPAIPLDALVVYRGVFDRLGYFNANLPLLDDWDFALRLARGTPLALTHAVTLDASARLGLAGQRLNERLAQVLPALDAIYAAYSVEADVAEQRRMHRADLAAALASAGEKTATTRGLAEFAAALAGRALAFPVAG
jgi:glycosyltransferase involved in cell wall biosynthesis